MSKSIPSLSDALMRYLVKQKELNLPATFVFGAYGDGSLQYQNQPSITALLTLEPLLELTLPALPARPRPTAVRSSFLDVKAEWPSKINVSSFDDKAWAGWASSSLLLAQQHVQRIAGNERVRRQLLQKCSQETCDRLTTLVELCRPDIVGTDIVKQEPEPSPREPSPQPQTPTLSTPATPSASSISFASRTDYANFSGGAVLKQCLLDPQGLLAAAYATPPPAAAANDESSDIDNDGENPLQTPAKKNPKAKAKAKASCRKKAAPKAQKAIEKPQSLCTKHGLLSIIKAKGRTHISCLGSESKRKQWVQVSEKDAEALDSDPLSVIVDIFRRIEEDDLDCEGAKRVKQEIMQ